MDFEIVKYKESHIQFVKDFNRRLSEGGSRYQFPESPIPKWLPKIEGRRLFQEFFIAIAENEVHGGYILKHQDFHVAGREVYLASYQLPLSEAAVDKSYRGLGRKLAEDALERQELLYTLGMGGMESPAAKSLRKMGWIMHLIPFYFKIVHPFNFLRNIKYLRTTALKKALLDILAISGLGWLAIRIMGVAKSRNKQPDGEVNSVENDVFEDWADELWVASRDFYVFSAVRDRKTLNILYPTSDHRFIRVLVKHQNRIVGWAVMLATQMSDHKYFGGMKVGTVVDCLALPGFERSVIGSAEESLRGREVDIIVSNQGHAAWCKALHNSGFMQGPSNFALAISPRLGKMLEPLDKNLELLHINRGDGGGPINL